MGFFGCVTNLEKHDLKTGEAVVVSWKKPDGSAYGGTEGVILGITGDKVSGEFLVIDRSTYHDSFKSALSLLDILDLRVIPLDNVEMMRKTGLRLRPQGVSETFKMKMRVDYKSNIDFEPTAIKIGKRTDCKVTPAQAPQSDAIYGIGITKIAAIKDASMTISAGGALQIFCPYKGLDDCVRWVQEAVELLQGHMRLVLIPTRIWYSVGDTYQEKAVPTDELIQRVATAQDGEPIVFPIGWVQWLFSELDENPLQQLFPSDQPLENFVFESEKTKRDAAASSNHSIEERSKQSVNLRFPWSKMKANKYLGADAPVTRITGLIKSPEDEDSLMRMWSESRSDCWQWFESEQFHGKIILRDLTIDKKRGVYTVDVRKHSGSEF